MIWHAQGGASKADNEAQLFLNLCLSVLSLVAFLMTAWHVGVWGYELAIEYQISAREQL